MKALTAAEMRDVDRLTTERHGISQTQLMENAGRAVAEFTLHEIGLRFAAARQVIVLCGKGNNGGDGLVAARHIREQIGRTAVVLFALPQELRGDAALNFRLWHEAGGETIVVESEAAWDAVTPRLASADIVLDALLGTGLRGTATGLIAKAITGLNALSRTATAARPGLIVAVDIPSGLPSDGQPAEGPVLAAHSTVTFTAPKIGQLLSRDAGSCGNLVVRTIGSPATLVEEIAGNRLRWSAPDEFAQLPLIRPADSHKGLYGHAVIVGGSRGMAGAAVLAGLGALKSGGAACGQDDATCKGFRSTGGLGGRGRPARVHDRSSTYRRRWRSFSRATRRCGFGKN